MSASDSVRGAKGDKRIAKIKSALPKELYVEMQDTGDGGFYPVTSADIETFEHGAMIGIYSLTEKRTKNVTHSLTKK